MPMLRCPKCGTSDIKKVPITKSEKQDVILKNRFTPVYQCNNCNNKFGGHAIEKLKKICQIHFHYKDNSKDCHKILMTRFGKRGIIKHYHTKKVDDDRDRINEKFNQIQDWDSLVSDLGLVQFFDWEHVYNDEEKSGNINWGLKVELDDGFVIERRGNNSFPGDWSSLVDFLKMNV